MNPALKQFLSGSLAGTIAAGTAAVAMLTEVQLEAVTSGQWVVIGVGGFLAAAKDWKTLLATPPGS